MGVYRGVDSLKAYKGDMQPVNVYKGSTKVAGWHAMSASGQSPLAVDCDYNVPPDALTIDGKCSQTGTPSPSSPAPISTITGNMTITGADGSASNTATVAFGSAVCASLPDGTHDTYDAVTGVLTKLVGKVVFDGSADEVWRYNSAWNTTAPNVFHAFLNIPSWSIGQTSVMNDSFGSFYYTNGGNYLAQECLYCNFVNASLYLFVSASRLATYDVAGFTQWLAANPVTVYYKLSTHTTVQLVPHLPVVRTGIKTLSIGADVAHTLSATVKSMD
jgi:hypothetical protein